MSDIVHRDAVEGDAATLADLFERSFTDTFGHLYKPEDLQAFLSRLTPEAWRKELADPSLAIRIVEADGEPAALAKVGPVGLPVEPRRPAIELRQLYVLEPWKGLGIAHQLMRWALGLAKAQRASEMYLSVYVDNHRARRFYERYGFEYVGPYSFMVGDHADEDHIMRLVLED